MEIVKPTLENIGDIEKILKEWTELEEVEKYLKRIKNEINGVNEFGMKFWVIKNNGLVIGVGGLSNILPSIKHFSNTKNPGEIKILYLNNKFRGQGFGKIFINFLEKEAGKLGYTELLIRSAQKYKETAYKFYEKVGYNKLGLTDNNMTVFGKQL